MLGTENLKKAVKLSIDIVEQIAEASKDGFQWTDSLGFLDELIQIPGLLKSGKDVMQELKDIDETERNDLYAYIQSEYDIPHDKTEVLVEWAFGFALNLALGVALIRALKDEAESPVI